MAEVIAIGGVPAVGKTTLMRRVLRAFKPLKKFKYGLVQGVYNKAKRVYIIGIYDNSMFSGTDKLSMAVQPHFKKFINKVPEAKIIFEGDRLFNQSLFDEIKCNIVVITADDKVIDQRHELRSDNQTEKFKRSKQTKINNIINNNNVKILNNNTDIDAEELYQYIINLIEK